MNNMRLNAMTKPVHDKLITYPLRESIQNVVQEARFVQRRKILRRKAIQSKIHRTK